jgi:Bifunctional DNA primase/polymerase, N-terminal/Primase C terminal 1 (PriCT-1)
VTDFRAVAACYAERGWTTHPLRLNSDGFAKVAMTEAWQELTLADVQALPWGRAAGLGVVLGRASGNAGIIDIDDAPLAADVAAYLIRQHICPLLAWTPRRRVHAYCIEPEPSRTRHFDLIYEGRAVKVDLLAEGAYAAAPPSPGYAWANPDWEPWYTSLSDAWSRIAIALGVTWPKHAADGSDSAAGYPKPWQPSVGRGERNNACFLEACYLAEDGVPIDKAIAFMQRRFAKAYESVTPGEVRELLRTIRSAYRKVGGR